MNKRVGILGLLVAVAVGLFHPATASAQDRNDYRRGYAQSYVQRDYRDHDREWRRDDRFRRNEWREARERQEWRERERCERGYGPGYYGPAVDFRLGWR